MKLVLVLLQYNMSLPILLSDKCRNENNSVIAFYFSDFKEELLTSLNINVSTCIYKLPYLVFSDQK